MTAAAGWRPEMERVHDKEPAQHPTRASGDDPANRIVHQAAAAAGEPVTGLQHRLRFAQAPTNREQPRGVLAR